MVVLSPAGMRILNRHIYDCKYQLIASSCGSDNIEPGGHLDPPHHVVYEVHPRTIQPISCQPGRSQFDKSTHQSPPTGSSHIPILAIPLHEHIMSSYTWHPPKLPILPDLALFSRKRKRTITASQAAEGYSPTSSSPQHPTYLGGLP